MTQMPMPDPAVSSASSPEEAALLAQRVRRLMMISAITTGVAVAAVLGTIGYRLFRGEGSVAPAAELTATLPKGGRIVSTAVAGERLLVTVEAGGAVEIHSFDARNLKPAGVLRFAYPP